MDKSRFNWRLVLLPVASLYGLVIWIRNACYDYGILKSNSFNLPVISVGNITVGGTGKTPHVEYLAGMLKEDYRVATLSRGYRRRTRDFRMVGPESSVRDVGDEPRQIKLRYPEIIVAVDRKRVNGIRELMKMDPPVEVILLDDAYQHRAVLPGYSILLIDYQRPLNRDYLMPAGYLREPASRRNRANLILVTRTPERMKPIELREYVNRLGLGIGQHLFFTSVRYGDLVPVYPDVRSRTAEWYRSRESGVLIVTGIARPREIRQYARGINPKIHELTFPDHHRYTPGDISRISQRYGELKSTWKEVLVLTTEKDAVKLREQEPLGGLMNDMHAIRIRIHFLNNDQENFKKQITDYVASNKRSSNLYQETD
jgi:tetraacyldisaccharide 4'-kinase